MTDKEILKAAAKAAGIEVKWSLDGDAAHSQCRVPGTWNYWNPLADDGDALRLAVKLGLTISPYMRGVFVSRDEGEPIIRNGWSSDRAKTTRFAIVRAAAAIGSPHNAELTGANGLPLGSG